MLDLSLTEAQLFRMLSGFFGREHVLFRMSLLTICGGELPQKIDFGADSHLLDRRTELAAWAKKSTCLFTIVDGDDNPKMVIEFFSGFENAVDPIEAEHQRLMKPILRAVNVPYVTFSDSEFEELLDPRSSIDFVTLLEAKFSEERGSPR